MYTAPTGISKNRDEINYQKPPPRNNHAALTEFYKVHKPSLVPRVGAILSKHRDQIPQLFLNVSRKYNVKPSLKPVGMPALPSSEEEYDDYSEDNIAAPLNLKNRNNSKAKEAKEDKNNASDTCSISPVSSSIEPESSSSSSDTDDMTSLSTVKKQKKKKTITTSDDDPAPAPAKLPEVPGSVYLEIVKGHELPINEIKTSNLYVKAFSDSATLDDSTKLPTIFKTNVIKKNLNPEWLELFTIEYASWEICRNATIHLEVWNSDGKSGKDILLGKIDVTHLHAPGLRSGRSQRRMLALSGGSCGDGGQISIQLTLTGFDDQQEETEELRERRMRIYSEWELRNEERLQMKQNIEEEKFQIARRIQQKKELRKEKKDLKLKLKILRKKTREAKKKARRKREKILGIDINTDEMKHLKYNRRKRREEKRERRKQKGMKDTSNATLDASNENNLASALLNLNLNKEEKQEEKEQKDTILGSNKIDGQLQEYIREQAIHSIFPPLIGQVLFDRPKDAVGYSIQKFYERFPKHVRFIFLQKNRIYFSYGILYLTNFSFFFLKYFSKIHKVWNKIAADVIDDVLEPSVSI